MKFNLRTLAALGGLILAFSVSVSPQMVAMSPFDIAPPTVLTEVKALRAANPKMTVSDFVDAANVLLAKQGIPFTFTFDDSTCAAIDKSIKSMKNPPAQINLRTKLRSVGGEPAVLTLPPADFANNGCGKCSVTLPVLEINEKEFVVLMWGRNIKFHLPANFAVGEAALYDEKELFVIKTKWRMPFRTKPLGVSYDGNVLYLGFPDPELKDISLAVFGEGVFQFAAREEAESNGKGTPIGLNAPTHVPKTNTDYILFENRGLRQRVSFSDLCMK